MPTRRHLKAAILDVGGKDPSTRAATGPAMSMPHYAMHQMEHGHRMDMQAMARDMRNRFWVSLVFAGPLFLLHPMGLDFIRVKPPFGLDLNLVMFFLASAAILYPGWPFVVEAVHAIRNRDL